MMWNWQTQEWPDFSWDAARLTKAEEQFLIGGGVFAGMIRHLDGKDSDELMTEALSAEAVATSEIEGEILDRASVKSSIRRQLGIEPIAAGDTRRIGPAERGIAEMTVDLHESFATPIHDGMLFAWNRMLTANRRDLQDIGCYRRHAEAMQIVSGAGHAPEIHFEAPPSRDVPQEMARFIDWFNRTAPEGASPLPALTRAGIAHLYFVCIHPFEDGNGRIGRAIAEKALAQSLGRPTSIALAATILAKRKAYYDALARNNTRMEMTDWLAWFAAAAIEAQRRAMAGIAFTIEKTRLLDRLHGQLNERQSKALLRMLREGPVGFKGGLSAENYRAITGAPTATATRDLADMVAKNALTRAGERRHARYHITISVQPVTTVTIDPDGRVSEAGATPVTPVR